VRPAGRPSRRTSRRLAALVLFVAACGGEPDEGPTSAVLITLDTTRADALSCGGAPPGITPNLDALARESVLYVNARTVAPITLPAHASMLTGLYPPRHTLRDNGLRALPASASTLAERAAAGGFQTAAFVASVVLDSVFGLDQGFETYGVPAAQHVFVGHSSSRNAAAVVDAALDWLDRRERGRPFLLWVHFFDPHLPHEAPPAFVQRARGHPYLAEVAYMDSEFGRLIAGLRSDGALDEALVMVVGDHGEGLNQHGEETHGAFCFDTTLRIPFLVRHPDGRRAAERSAETVSAVDVFPTLLAAMGLEPDETSDGRSLYRATIEDGRGVYFESYFGFLNYGWAPLTGWADERGKYVHAPRPLLFDIGADPTESSNLLADGRDAMRYREGLARVARGEPLTGGSEQRVGEGMVAELRSLGYAAASDAQGSVPGALAELELPDPHERVDELRALARAQGLLTEGRARAAVELLLPIARANRRNALAIQYLASAYIAQEQYELAVPWFELVLSTSADRADPHNNYGYCLERLGRVDAAIVQYRRALAIDPNKLEALRNLARALRATGATDELPDLRRRIRAIGG